MVITLSPFFLLKNTVSYLLNFKILNEVRRKSKGFYVTTHYPLVVYISFLLTMMATSRGVLIGSVESHCHEKQEGTLP